VLDPFAGFGTTLLAAYLEGRRGLGIEFDPRRLALARERLQRHGVEEASLVEGDARDTALPPIDLCLTSVPYFGCRPDPGAGSRQLYAATQYESYLEALHAIFRALRRALRPDATVVVMAQTLRFGDDVLPLPFDLSRLLTDLFQRCDERILLYPRTRAPLAQGDARSNRAHEYALVFRHAPRPLDTGAALALLHQARDAGLVFELHGSFARWLETPAQSVPQDVDLVVAPQQAALDAMLGFLGARGFHLRAWQQPRLLPVDLNWVIEHHYVRAERHDADGRRLQIDVGVAEPHAAASTHAGLRVRPEQGVVRATG
jgi:SAM-dependent methyltransferase